MKLLVSTPLSRKHLSVSEFNRSHALKSEQKEAISALVSGNDSLAVLPASNGRCLPQSAKIVCNINWEWKK